MVLIEFSIPRNQKEDLFEGLVEWGVQSGHYRGISASCSGIQHRLCIAAGSLFWIKKLKDFENGLILASIRQHNV